MYLLKGPDAGGGRGGGLINQAWNLEIVPPRAQFTVTRQRPGVRFMETDVVKGQVDVKESSSNTSSLGGKGQKGRGPTSS